MLQGGPLSSTRQRRALAALVVAHGEVVSADRLADIVWDGDPPSNMNALQTYMSRLRAVLGADSIQTRPPGYALALPIDAVRSFPAGPPLICFAVEVEPPPDELQAGAIATKAGTVVTATPYVGGVAPGGPKWWQGWTSYARN